MERFCMFVAYFVNGKTSEYLIEKSDLLTWTETFKELHHTPGVNPHVHGRDNRTSKIYMIRVYQMSASGPYWWTTPGLEKRGTPKQLGAKYWEKDLARVKTVFHDSSIDPFNGLRDI